MDSSLVASRPTAGSFTTGANLSGSKHSTNNIYYASLNASKVSQQKRRFQIQKNVVRFQQPSLNYHHKFIEGGSTYQECNKKYIVKAIPKSSFDSKPNTSESKNISDSIKSFLDVFYKFCYPYALIATALCAISSSILTVEKLSDISPSIFVGALQAFLPQFFMSIHVSAVNQIFDFEIDKINKPYLPLASGQLSFTTMVIIATSCLTLSVLLSWVIGSWPLIWNVIFSASIWGAYSINAPLLRWKRHPLLAAICTISFWAFVLPITSFLHVQTFVLKRPAIFSRPLIFYVAFMSFYSTGMALSKDIPDIEGDKSNGIDTFSIRLGQKQVFWLCVFLFEMAFGIASLAGASSSFFWIRIVTGLGHIVLASILWYQAKSIDFSNKASSGFFYMLIWKLLYAAYFLMALIR
ncbi:hypothetical protein VNO78_18732 [Psophocarpus tetragonolobus]|uniref:Glycinol 4-dimethylallyltransferase n=1 Tax=Psophocarpus tetragonolobus TaxID=3891 RepID=A0AAN9SAR8_PSOTE